MIVYIASQVNLNSDQLIYDNNVLFFVFFTENGYMSVITNFDWKIIESDLKMSIRYLLMCDMDITTDSLLNSSIVLAIMCNLYYLEQLAKTYHIPFDIDTRCFYLTNIEELHYNLDDIECLKSLMTCLVNFVRCL